MRTYFKISLIYLVAGVCWILITDLKAFSEAEETAMLTQFQLLKGWLFVVLSTLLIFFLTRQTFRAQERAQEERNRLYRKTIQVSCHIVLNYLNEMQLVLLEAEKSKDFDPEIRKLAQRVSDETAEQLKGLQFLEDPSAEKLESAVFGRLRELSGPLVGPSAAAGTDRPEQET